MNEETPGFEAIQNAMALVEAPSGQVSDGVTVALVETLDDLAASDHVTVKAFGMGPTRARRWNRIAPSATPSTRRLVTRRGNSSPRSKRLP